MAFEPKSLQAICEKAAPPGLEVSFRPMFGGILGYADGKAFASLSDVGLALKVSGLDRDGLLALAGAKPLQYEPDKPPSKSYVVVPEEMHSDVDALRAWMLRSVAGLSAKSSSNRKRQDRK